MFSLFSRYEISFYNEQKNRSQQNSGSGFLLVIPARIELATYRLGVREIINLSIFFTYYRKGRLCKASTHQAFPDIHHTLFLSFYIYLHLTPSFITK